MDEKVLRERLNELCQALTALPQTDAADPSKGAYVSHVPPMPSRSIDEILDHARLQAKYLTFDLEATRRENRYLRQMLERRTNLGDGSDNY